MLEYVTGEGFPETMARYGVTEFASAKAFRERHVVMALKKLGGS